MLEESIEETLLLLSKNLQLDETMQARALARNTRFSEQLLELAGKSTTNVAQDLTELVKLQATIEIGGQL